MSKVTPQSNFLDYQPEDFNDLDSDQYEIFHGHPENIQKWLATNGIELCDSRGDLLDADILSDYELDDFRQLLIDNGYLDPFYDVDRGSSRVASSTNASRWTQQISFAAVKPLPSIPFDSADTALDHIKSVFVDDYYSKTLTALDDLLKPVSYADSRSGVIASVPNYVRSLLAIFVQGWIQNPKTAENGIVAALKEIGVRGDDLASLARSCAGACYKMLWQMLRVPDGVKLQDSDEYKTFRASLKTSGFIFPMDSRSALESIDKMVLQGVDRLFAANALELSGIVETENGLVSTVMNWGGPDGTHWLPLADVHDCIVTQKNNVCDSMERIKVMNEPGDIAHLLKSFEGDINDVHWIYDQLGIPKNHDGQYLIDEIYERLKTMNVNLVDMTPILAPLARNFNVDQKTWDLCAAIAKEKKKIAFQETAFMVLAVGASITAVVGGAVVAGPVGGMVAGGAVSATIGGVDVYKTQRPLDDVSAANTAHRLVKMPIGDDEHVELVSETRDYAIKAAVANTLLAIVGGAVNPALGAAAKVVIPGKTLTQITLRALLNTSLQGGYGAVDGALSASFDGRQTNQSHLDKRHAMSGAEGEAPRAVTAIVFSAALGGAFGAGSEVVFGSGKFEILCALDGNLPTIVDAVTGRVLKGFRISADGQKIIAPNGESRPIIVNDESHVVVRDGEEDLPTLKDEDVTVLSSDADIPTKIPTRKEFSEAFPFETGADGYPVTYINLDPKNPNDQWRIIGYDEISGMVMVEKTRIKMRSLDSTEGGVELDGFSRVMKFQGFSPGQKIMGDDGVEWTVVTADTKVSERVTLSRKEQRQVEAAKMMAEPKAYSPDIITRQPSPEDKGFLQRWIAFYDFFASGRYRQDVIKKIGSENVSIAPRYGGEAVEMEFPDSQRTQWEGFAADVDLGKLEHGQMVKDLNGVEWGLFTESGNQLTLWNRDGVYTSPKLIPHRQMAHVYDVLVRLPSGETHVIEVAIPHQSNAAKDNSWLKLINDIVAYFPADFVTTCERIVINPKNFSGSRSTYATAEAGNVETGVRPTIDFYPAGLSRKGSVILDTAWHELGHLIVARYFSADCMPPNRWMDAIVRDGDFVSYYAQTNVKEDFAETVMKYIATDGGATDPALRQRFAERFKLLDDIFAVNPHEKAWVTTQIYKFISLIFYSSVGAGLGYGGLKIYDAIVEDDDGGEVEIEITLH